MKATINDHTGESATVEIPTQRAFPDYIIHVNRVFKRIGSVTSSEFQEVTGRVVRSVEEDEEGVEFE